METFKIALAQVRAIENRRDESLREGLALARRAKEQGADLLLFPELWSNGYTPPFAGAFEHPLDERFAQERQDWLDAAE